MVEAGICMRCREPQTSGEAVVSDLCADCIVSDIETARALLEEDFVPKVFIHDHQLTVKEPAFEPAPPPPLDSVTPPRGEQT